MDLISSGHPGALAVALQVNPHLIVCMAASVQTRLGQTMLRSKREKKKKRLLKTFILSWKREWVNI
jgi:hypothetical protein